MDKNKSVKEPALKRIFAGNSYCWLAVLCTAAIMMLVYFVFDLWPFGDITILRMDLYHQYGPLFAEFYDRVTGLESFFYSWRTGLGSPFLGNYFNYLSSPAALIILLLGHKNMPESIAGMILLKAALSAGSFTLYLKKSRGRHDFTTAAFGILYAMCGYFVAYYWNVMWIDAMVYFPMVMYGIEKIIGKRRPAVYIIFLALTLLSNYYMGFMTCVFSVIYFFVYYISTKEFTSLADDAVYYRTEDGEKAYTFKEKLRGSVFLRSAVTFALGSIAAGCVAAFSLLPVFSILRSCSATSGTPPQNYRIYFSAFDFLANHLASVDPTIRSSGDDVLPNVFCGMITLILVPLYIFSKRVTLKEKIVNVFTLGIIYFSFNINYLNYFWHGFHFPNDLPYRFSYMYCFLLLTLAYRAFTNLSEYSGRQILGSGVAIVFMIILVQEIGSKNVQDITVLLSLIFVVTYSLLLYLLKDENKQKSAIAVVLLCAVIAEVACSNTDRYSMSQTKTSYASDYDDFRALKARLDDREGNDDYRMELTYNRARMDPAWYGYNGISTFSSMAYEKMANMQSNLGVYGNFINSYTYYLQTPVYNMMNALKYVVNNDETVSVSDDYYTEADSEGKFTAYENKYYLPVAFAVNKDIKDWYSAYTNPFLSQMEWFKFASGANEVFGRMTVTDIRYFNIDEIDTGIDTGEIYFSKTSSGPADMTLVLAAPETKHCYLFVDSNNFDSITVDFPDGSSKVQYIDEPYIFDLGILEAGETVEVLITPDDESSYCNMDFFPYYVNDDSLDEGYETLKEGAMEVNSYEDTRIEGTLAADSERTVFTSIPYDKGWSVTVDGKKVKTFALEDAYLCFDIDEGEHSVVIKYRQRFFFEGVAISALTLLLLLVLALITKKTGPERKKKNAEKCRAADEKYELEKQLRQAEEERLRLLAQMPGDVLPVDMELFDDLTGDYPEAPGETDETGENAGNETDAAEEAAAPGNTEEPAGESDEENAESTEDEAADAGQSDGESAEDTDASGDDSDGEE